MNYQRIIMNFTVPPTSEDLEALAGDVLETLPDEILRSCEDVSILVEDFSDEATQSDLDVDDPYDLLAFYKSAREISPGVERKVANDDDVLILYRRPILDMWAETGDDLQNVIRQIMIEELGRHFEFSDDDIDEMAGRHYQGLL